jgi:hypothetical protein
MLARWAALAVASCPARLNFTLLSCSPPALASHAATLLPTRNTTWLKAWAWRCAVYTRQLLGAGRAWQAAVTRAASSLCFEAWCPPPCTQVGWLAGWQQVPACLVPFFPFVTPLSPLCTLSSLLGLPSKQAPLWLHHDTLIVITVTFPPPPSSPPHTHHQSSAPTPHAVCPSRSLAAAFVLDPAQSAERGLLMVVLALIHLAGSKLGQGECFAATRVRADIVIGRVLLSSQGVSFATVLFWGDTDAVQCGFHLFHPLAAFCTLPWFR